jgi:hypothetical protein
VYDSPQGQASGRHRGLKENLAGDGRAAMAQRLVLALFLSAGLLAPHAGDVLAASQEGAPQDFIFEFAIIGDLPYDAPAFLARRRSQLRTCIDLLLTSALMGLG